MRRGAHVIGIIELGEGVHAARGEGERRRGHSTCAGAGSAGSRAGDSRQHRHRR